MPCVPFTTPDGIRGIACSRGRRAQPKCSCGRPSAFQCDAEAPKRRSGTCDKHLCAACATEVGPDRHLCPAHAQEREPAQVGLF